MGSVNIKDIARMCGVGVSTVSRALNNHPDINPATREKIMQCIRENNYIPNNSARNLKRQEAKVIAILVKGLSNMFLIGMTKILEAEIEKRGYSVALERIKFEEDEVDVALELVKEKRLKGIIFLGGDFEHRVDKLKELDVPFILSTAGSEPDMQDSDSYSSVSVDDIRESYRMTDYLIKLGHRRIAILSANADDESVGYLRIEGYKKALADNGIEFDKDLVIYMRKDIEDYSMENGYVVTKEFLKKKIPCTALFAISDTLAIGACRALHDEGLRIPEDISVAGFDGVDAGIYSYPSITTIAQPGEDMAKETAKILFDIIKGKGKHKHKIFDAELVERESTACLTPDE
ncbi:transcriptional regulator, LacI family [Lachnospiraceae bacterium KH1T2]|nr:transcriptional regulator, LacI family [Lachnospiraceae bacterium KH1T2]